MRPEPHYIYRAFREDGRLLYVGCSIDVDKRLVGHASTSSWHPLMAHHTVEGPWLFHEARQREADAVMAERPLYNYDTPFRWFVRHRWDDVARDVCNRVHESGRYLFTDAWDVGHKVAASFMPTPARAGEPFEYADSLHIAAAHAYRRYMESDPRPLIEAAIARMLNSGWAPEITEEIARLSAERNTGDTMRRGAEAAGRIG